MFWAVVQTVANFADSGGSVFGSGMYYNTVHVLQLRCACLSIARIQHFLRKICCSEVAIFFLFFLLCPSHHKQTLKNANTDFFFYTSQWQTLDYGKFQALVYCCLNAVPHGNVVIMDKKLLTHTVYYSHVSICDLLPWHAVKYTHRYFSWHLFLSQDKTDSKTQFLAPNVSIRLKNRVISCQNMRFAFIPSQISFKYCSAQRLKAKMI